MPSKKWKKHPDVMRLNLCIEVSTARCLSAVVELNTQNGTYKAEVYFGGYYPDIEKRDFKTAKAAQLWAEKQLRLHVAKTIKLVDEALRKSTDKR